jgi:hypothetical protein
MGFYFRLQSITIKRMLSFLLVILHGSASEQQSMAQCNTILDAYKKDLEIKMHDIICLSPSFEGQLAWLWFYLTVRIFIQIQEDYG